MPAVPEPFRPPGKMQHPILPEPPPAPPHLLDIAKLDGSPWGNPAFDTSAPGWQSSVVHGKTFDGSADHKFEWVSVLSPEVEQDDEVGLAGTAVRPNDSQFDLPFTHPFGPDFEFTIAPDPIYSGLLADSNKDPKNPSYTDDWQAATASGIGAVGLLPVEVDGALVPPAYRCQHGDRVAVYGRWIIDAGHEDFHAEIHPPLLMARARSVDDNGNATAPSEGATTLFQLWSRPYQAGQTFTSGGHSGLTLRQYIKDIVSTLGNITATPPVFAKPFDGIHLVCFKIRPPVQLSPPKLATALTPELEYSYHFTVNGACGVEVTRSPSDPQSVQVVLALNSAGYPALPEPTRHSESMSIDTLLASKPAGVDLDWLQQAWADFKEAEGIFGVGGDIGFNLCEAPHMSQTQDQVNVVPFTPLSGLPSSSQAVDKSQPFPVYGWLKLRWVTPTTTELGSRHS
jgi:hypothetical protein